MFILTVASIGCYRISLDCLWTAIKIRKYSVLHILWTFFVPVGKFMIYGWMLLTYSPIV